jgi:multicomponent Na+:H+ antiporter subunit G
MTLADWTTVFLGMAGAAFFLAGTVGILRFPDFFSRLHAVTKADTLGLGLIVTGLLFQATNLAGGLKLVLIWVLAMIASSSACYLMAGCQRDQSATRRVAGKDDEGH